MTTKWMARYERALPRILCAQVEVVRMTTTRAMLAQRYEVAGHRLRVYSEELHDTKAAALEVARQDAWQDGENCRNHLRLVDFVLERTKP